MRDISYEAVMARRPEIMKAAVGMDYSKFESGSIAFDYEGMLASTGLTIDEVRRIQRSFSIGNTPLLEMKNLTALARKLAPADRMIGSSLLALEQGITPAYIAVGAAAALHRYIREAEGMEQSMDSATKVLAEVAGLAADSKLAQLILPMYQMILDGAAPAELRRAADAIKHSSIGEVV